MLGLIKAIVSIQILILALMLGIMVDMLGSMIAAGLPVFLMLSLIPKVEDIANKMLDALPAILLLPVMSAIIIVVGAGSIVEAGDNSTGDEGFMGTVYTWITSVGVVFFAITLPTIMIPLLSTVSQMATQVVSSAVSTGTMVGGQAVAGAASGGVSAFRGNKSGGLSALGSMAGGILKGGGGGLMHGTAGSAGPNVGGFSMTSADALASTMGKEWHPTGMPGSAQQAHVADVLGKEATAGYNEKNIGNLQQAFPKGGFSGYNDTQSPEWNRDNTNDKIDKLDMDNISPDQRKALVAVHGEQKQFILEQGGGRAIRHDNLDAQVEKVMAADPETYKDIKPGVVKANYATAAANHVGVTPYDYDKFILSGKAPDVDY